MNRLSLTRSRLSLSQSISTHAFTRTRYPAPFTHPFSTATTPQPSTDPQPHHHQQPPSSPSHHAPLSKFIHNLRSGAYDPFGRFKATFADLLLWLLVGSLAFDLRTVRQDTDDFKRTAAIKDRKLVKEIHELRKVWDPAYDGSLWDESEEEGGENVDGDGLESGGAKKVGQVEEIVVIQPVVVVAPIPTATAVVSTEKEKAVPSNGPVDVTKVTVF
ncbi:hypothetical protein BCR33DRAFT_735037 [Rhizoclosmatium globosum]|uniref:Uncharacterized protein n=1 Tax=Rhizoclosmatium globosum TaxID=329046 RepID=A0A1Y2CRJ3_9FUNG|nr:hypothetical protein BCR33DRAFT_735037 [Rhizoclosmatium globosum]|eukprot:ORY49613.1 hypothetical protein BCR33DRAFT_735037 [Rhizoclosmatium globosum]